MDAFFEHHRKSIRFRYRCFDRILLNALIQPFQQPERVVGFFGSYRKQSPIISTCAPKPATNNVADYGMREDRRASPPHCGPGSPPLSTAISMYSKISCRPFLDRAQLRRLAHSPCYADTRRDVRKFA